MKTARKIISIIYALSSLVLVGIVVMSAVYAFTKIGTNGTSIGIIGGADGPTAKLITMKLLGSGVLGLLLFPISLVLFNVVNIISAFIKKQYKALNIVLLVWTVFNALLILMIPSQSTAIAMYMLYSPIIDTVWTVIFMNILSPQNIFLLSSVVMTVLFVLALVKFKKPESKAM